MILDGGLYFNAAKLSKQKNFSLKIGLYNKTVEKCLVVEQV